MREQAPPPGSPAEKLLVVEGDITEQEVDAIVNPANPTLLGGGGADGAIHRAAGPGLREECSSLGGCQTGEAKITGGYRLPARFVIHTVGPIWHGGAEGEDDLLAGCYRSSLLLAGSRGLTSIAFPAISTGAYGFPFLRAARIAVATVLGTLPETPAIGLVVFVCHGAEAAGTYRRVISSLVPRILPDSPEPGHPAGGGGLPRGETVDRVGAHLRTIESAYGIRIANLDDVAGRIAGATADDREILAIATAISSYIAVHPPLPVMEIPDGFLGDVIRRFAGRERSRR